MVHQGFSATLRSLEVNTERYKTKRNKRRTVRREVIQTESTKETRAFAIKKKERSQVK